MISVSDAFKTEFESYSLTPVMLVELDFPTGGGGNLKITDAPIDITIGSDTYTSTDQLLSMATPQTQNSVDRDTYSLQFTDTDAAMRDRFEGTGIGVPLTVRMAIRKSDGTLTSDVLDIYKGQSSSYSWKVEGKDPRLTATFTGQLARLSSAKPLWTTPASQANLDSTDQCFKYVSSTVNDRVIRWGRKD